MIAQQHTLPLCAYYTSLDLVPSSDKCYLENLNLGLYSFHTKTELAISPNTAIETRFWENSKKIYICHKQINNNNNHHMRSKILYSQRHTSFKSVARKSVIN